MNSTERSCGQCRECCIHVKVDAFDKPAGVHCQHLNILQDCGACGIYENRPSECARYTCAWLEGYFPEAMRPDKSGLLLETATFQSTDTTGKPHQLNVLMGFEHKPGAVDVHFAEIQEAAKDGTVIGLVPFDHSDIALVGSERDLNLFMAFMAGARNAGGITHKFSDGDVYQELP